MEDFTAPDRISVDEAEIQHAYVAYCDVLGFSSAVTKDFLGASKIYVDFINNVRMIEPIRPADVTVYSDSILVTSPNLHSVLSTVNLLWWSALLNDWLIRGGIAYGRIWQRQYGKDLFVVSEPLVRAAQIEKSVRVPAVQVAPEIEIPEDLWITRFSNGPLSTPILHFGGMNIVNPFNNFWYNSAYTRVAQLLESHPEHSDKYYWFLALAEKVGESDAALIPKDVLTSFERQGIVKFVSPAEAIPNEG